MQKVEAKADSIHTEGKMAQRLLQAKKPGANAHSTTNRLLLKDFFAMTTAITFLPKVAKVALEFICIDVMQQILEMHTKVLDMKLKLSRRETDDFHPS